MELIIIILAFVSLFFLAMLYMSWLGSPIAADIISGAMVWYNTGKE